MKQLFLLAVLAFSLLGCGKEVARVPNAKQGAFEGAIVLSDASPLDVWVHLDISHASNARAGFDVVLEQDGSAVSRANCSAFNPSVKMMSLEMHVGSKWSTRYDGKMRECVLQPKHAGPAVVKARFQVLDGGPELELRDATLFFKK